MELFDAINRRYSYRGAFTDAAVSRDDLCKIVQAGIQAPSGANAQVATFIIVDDPAVLQKIAATLPEKLVCSTAKAMIVCVTDSRPVYKDLSFDREDVAASVENMLLAITALGYATVWLDGVIRFDNLAQQVADILNVPEGHEVRVILPLGVPADPGQQNERKPFEQRAWFNQYGGTA